MICCTREPIEVTDGDDVVPVFLCQNCGKQGPARMFPDPDPEPPKRESFIVRARWWLAELIAPKQ